MWVPNALNADKKFVMVQYGGLVNLSNVNTGAFDALPTIFIGPLRSAQVTLTGFQTTTPLSSLFSSAGAGGSVTMSNYSQTNNIGQVTDKVPFWTKNFGAFKEAQLPTFNDGLLLGANVRTKSGAGSPEGVVDAAIGSLYLRTDGGVGTTLYIKESGTGNTGWVAK